MSRKIFLIGMPGSGKSRFGKILAEKMEWPLFDLDKEIEAEIGYTIAEFFQAEGESKFRDLERKHLHRFLQMDGDFILSTGGGAPCFFDNMQLMQAAGFTIFLEASREELIERTSRNAKRPLLHGDVEKKISELLEKRLPIYQQAHLAIEHRDTEILVPQIHQFFKN